MDTFLQLNRQKLQPVFVRLSLTSLGAVSIVLFIAFLTGNLPSGQLLFYILLTTCIVFPIFLMTLGYIGWKVNHKARQNAFAKVPFSDIEKIGFYKTYIGNKSKLSFRKEIKKGQINGFALTMDISNEKANTLEFIIPTEWKKIDKNEFLELTEKFKQHNLEFRIGSIVKQYDTKQPKFKTISELQQDLELTTTILLQEGFQAKT